MARNQPDDSMTDDLRKLARAATPGPWRRDKEKVNRVGMAYDVGTVCYTRCVSDAEYFAALFPERVLAMLRVIDAAKEKP
jgi:hypothetical protein